MPLARPCVRPWHSRRTDQKHRRWPRGRGGRGTASSRGHGKSQRRGGICVGNFIRPAQFETGEGLCVLGDGHTAVPWPAWGFFFPSPIHTSLHRALHRMSALRREQPPTAGRVAMASVHSSLHSQLPAGFLRTRQTKGILCMGRTNQGLRLLPAASLPWGDAGTRRGRCHYLSSAFRVYRSCVCVRR